MVETIVPVDLNFRAIAPLVTLAAAGLLTLLLDLILPKDRSRPWWYVAAAGGVAVAMWYVIDLWSYVPLRGATSLGVGEWGRLTEGISVFGGAYIVDRFTLLFEVIVLIAAFGAILMSAIRKDEEMSGYLALVMGAALGMCVLVGAGNLLTLFLGLEILSLNLYVGVAFRRDHRESKEAALKYLILGSVASAVMLYGFAFFYGQTGSISLAALAAGWGSESTLFMKVGLGLTLIGLAFKLALAPFHAWAPDVYQGASAPFTALMSVGTKAAAFAATVRILMAVLPAESADALTLPLWVLAVVSMLVGSFGAVAQQNVKRLLAYSGIAHAGYLMMALLGVSNQGIRAGVFYLFAYLFMNLGAFAVIAALGRGEEEGELISDFRGLFYRRPLLALAMTLFMLSLAGFPPAGGFTGKLFLILSALGSGTGAAAGWLVGAMVATTGVSAFAYLRVVTAMFRRTEPAAAAADVGGTLSRREVAAASGRDSLSAGAAEGAGAVSRGAEPFSWALGVVVGIAAIGSLYLGVLPRGIFTLADRLLPLL